MKILLLLAAVAAVSRAQSDCSRGACYPPSGDLLQGRAQQLRASSTCGLHGSEVYCTPFQVRRMKCCPCDSRNPHSQLAHTVQDVLSTADPDRWWQSKKDESPVTLQLDLHDLFQLDNLVLSFKGPRPDALVIERTLDKGRTWQPALYMASDCQTAFPGVPTTMPRTLDQTYCYTLPPTGGTPYTDQIVQFSPLRQYSYVPVPNDRKIEDVAGLTGLRVRLTHLGEVPRLPGQSRLSKFYALKEMRVMGSCMCHGHANRCLPDTSSNTLPNSIQVNAQCECQHNTAGVNCERCTDLYNDLPWSPAEEGNTHTCKRCECNNHAQRCRFDQAVYEASGRRSGGVCDECLHHTAGPKCDQCAPGYHPNPRSRMDRPDACTRCVCSAEGTVDGAQCDDRTGSCQCKANAEGPRCDRCRRGYYGLTASNPLGCSKCSCSPDGSGSDVCDPVTGQCPCRPHSHGRTCEQCARGYWKPSWARACEPCGCDPATSRSDTCDQWTGQCQCRTGFGGRTCTECPDNTFGDPLVRCRSCQCDPEGTDLPQSCNKKTGVCLCRPGVTGARCDACSRGHCDSFPTCEMCPSCFFSLDTQRQHLSLGLERLSLSLPTRPGAHGEYGPRIHALETRLTHIRDSISLPPNSARQTDDALLQLSRLRDHMEQVNGDIFPLETVPGLDSQLDKLQALLDGLRLEYNAKKDAPSKSGNTNYTGAFSAIKTAYDESTDAAKSVEASGNTVQQSAAVREDTLDLQNKVQPDNTRDLEKLNQHLLSRPDLTPTAEQVCGIIRSTPCTPLQCEGGKLCPAEKVATCGRGENCVGALPLSNRALDDAKEVKDRLSTLSGKITQAAEQLQQTQETTNQVRMSAEKLSNQMKKTRDDLEADLKQAHDVVKDLKDFLTSPSSNLTDIKELSEWILKAKLPLSLAALKRKLEELKELAAGLPNSTAVLNDAEPQLHTARKLLEQAQNARDAALGVKADVDGLLQGLASVEDSLAVLEGKVQDSMDLTDKLNKNLAKAKAQLSPAEKAIEDISELTTGIKPQLAHLKDMLQTGGRLAQDATENAGKAEEEAAAAAKDLLALEKQLERLRAAEGSSGRGDGAKTAGERLKSLQQGAHALVTNTADIMKALAGKADSLRKLQDEVVKKSGQLEGLDEKLKRLLEELRVKAHTLSSCQG